MAHEVEPPAQNSRAKAARPSQLAKATRARGRCDQIEMPVSAAFLLMSSQQRIRSPSKQADQVGFLAAEREPLETNSWQIPDARDL